MISLDASVYTPGTRHSVHEHDTLQLSLVLAGSLAETVSSVTEHARALSVVAKDPGVAHADDFGAGASLIRLTFPRGTLDDFVDDKSRARPWIWTHHAAVAKPFLRLVNRSRSGTREFAQDDDDIVDLLASLTSRSVSDRVRPPAWLNELMTEVRSSWTPDLTVHKIARRARVHPVYLARCVRRWYGIGVAEELRRLRLEASAAALTLSPATVSSIAHRNGFSDEPHLCREFGRALGVTPRRYRSIVSDLT